MPDSVGLIGYGHMGRGFARNLMRAGHEVLCFDVSGDATKLASQDGATPLGSPSEVAVATRLLLSVVPAAPHVRDIVLGDDGIAGSATEDHTLVEFSTIDPMTIIDVQNSAAASGLTILDGGISASPRSNWEGKGTLMVGGSAESFEAVRSVLAELCANLYHTGELGSAKVAKLINNLMGGVSMAALSEAFRLAGGRNVDASVLYDGMMGSWARCAILERMPPNPDLRSSDGDDEFPDFSIDYMLKDLTSYCDTAEDSDESHAMAEAARRLFDGASEAGLGAEPIWRLIDSI